MVCVPCIVIPVVLWIFNRFVRPMVVPLLGDRLLGKFDAFDRWFTSAVKLFLPTPAPKKTLDQVPAEVKEFVDETIKSNKVVVFSKASCPFCVQVKRLLRDCQSENLIDPANISVLELEGRKDVSDIQDYLFHKTGERTVPRVFIDGSSVGGAMDCQGLYSRGELEKLLKAA